jgi:hypothetical protein
LSNPSAVDTTIPTFTNGTAEVLTYYHSQTVTVPAGATTGTGVPTTDTIAESMRPLLLSLELLRLLEQSMIMMRLL